MTTGMKNMGLSSLKGRIGGEVHQEALLIYYYMGRFPPTKSCPETKKDPPCRDGCTEGLYGL